MAFERWTTRSNFTIVSHSFGNRLTIPTKRYQAHSWSFCAIAIGLPTLSQSKFTKLLKGASVLFPIQRAYHWVLVFPKDFFSSPLSACWKRRTFSPKRRLSLRRPSRLSSGNSRLWRALPTRRWAHSQRHGPTRRLSIKRAWKLSVCNSSPRSLDQPMSKSQRELSRKLLGDGGAMHTFYLLLHTSHKLC